LSIVCGFDEIRNQLLEFEERKIQNFTVLQLSAKWENISITSTEVDFWGVKNSGCENSHATEVKCSNIPQKS
jgi:hypothetical protein